MVHVHDIWSTMFNPCYKTVFLSIKFKLKVGGARLKDGGARLKDGGARLKGGRARLKEEREPWYHPLGETLPI